MKKIIHFGFISLFLVSCSKDNSTQDDMSGVNQFKTYTIRKGQNFSDENKFVSVNYSELRFMAKFDSTSIYQTLNSGNQYDINKLYGFSDNEANHQQFSARFGWRWSDNALRLYGYVYNNGIRDSKELGTVSIGSENNCSIKVNAKSYVFSLNGKADSLPRTSITATATGYKLYPYFGGDEPAPHTILIFIKDL